MTDLGPWALIVDDDPPLRMLVSYHLTALGGSVVEAVTAAEAQTLLRSRPFALVLVDHNLLDGPTGVDVLELAGQAAGQPTLVLMSGIVDGHTQAEAARVGAQVINKMDLAPLTRLWAELVRSWQADHDAPTASGPPGQPG